MKSIVLWQHAKVDAISAYRDDRRTFAGLKDSLEFSTGHYLQAKRSDHGSQRQLKYET
jgi:hypothetical protein